MSNLNEIVATATRMISDHGNATLSKGITYFGISGIGVGTVNAVATEVSQECAKYSPDWLAWAPLIGVVSLAVKNACDIYYRRLELKLKKEQSDASGDGS